MPPILPYLFVFRRRFLDKRSPSRHRSKPPPPSLLTGTFCVCGGRFYCSRAAIVLAAACPLPKRIIRDYDKQIRATSPQTLSRVGRVAALTNSVDLPP